MNKKQNTSKYGNTAQLSSPRVNFCVPHGVCVFRDNGPGYLAGSVSVYIPFSTQYTGPKFTDNEEGVTGWLNVDEVPFSQMGSMVGRVSFAGSRVYMRTSFTGGGIGGLLSIGVLRRIVTGLRRVGLEVLRCQRRWKREKTRGRRL
jgi:hypothetical protein